MKVQFQNMQARPGAWPVWVSTETLPQDQDTLDYWRALADAYLKDERTKGRSAIPAGTKWYGSQDFSRYWFGAALNAARIVGREADFATCWLEAFTLAPQYPQGGTAVIFAPDASNILADARIMNTILPGLIANPQITRIWYTDPSPQATVCRRRPLWAQGNTNAQALVRNNIPFNVNGRCPDDMRGGHP